MWFYCVKVTSFILILKSQIVENNKANQAILIETTNSSLDEHNKKVRQSITNLMDIDENSGQGPPPSQGGDIDTSFLQQFSCLGTTDHDELIVQLQKVLGNQLNYTTARFFLDMNNW